MKLALRKLADLKLANAGFPGFMTGGTFNRSFLLKVDINPYLVYSVLRDQFGPPTHSEPDDEKNQWQWCFSYGDFYVEVYDWRLVTSSIGIYHADRKESEKLAIRINELLTKASRGAKDRIRMAIKGSRRKLLENPFVTYYSIAENLLELASAINDMSSKGTFSMLISQEGDHANEVSISLWEKKYDLYRSAFLMFLSSFEGFLNILYELYLKPELRSDRLSDRIAREQIDIRLRIAPIYCDGFRSKVIDNSDERYKAYSRLINLRNDFVHANLTRSLERYLVEENDYIFLIENEDRGEIPSNINKISLEHVELAKKIIDDVVKLVFESMEVKTKREFKSVIFEGEIEVEDEEGVLVPAMPL
jgi:hypothetical protein